MASANVDLKKTINLPRTDFPMKASLGQLEPRLLAQWDESKIYDRIREARAGRPTYILHDGPPYANGEIHLGTAFNKILKDFIIRTKTMEGFDSPYVPGWDCHGLPMRSKSTASSAARKRRCRSHPSARHAASTRKNTSTCSVGISSVWEFLAAGRIRT